MRRTLVVYSVYLMSFLGTVKATKADGVPMTQAANTNILESITGKKFAASQMQALHEHLAKALIDGLEGSFGDPNAPKKPLSVFEFSESQRIAAFYPLVFRSYMSLFKSSIELIHIEQGKAAEIYRPTTLDVGKGGESLDQRAHLLIVRIEFKDGTSSDVEFTDLDPSTISALFSSTHFETKIWPRSLEKEKSTYAVLDSFDGLLELVGDYPIYWTSSEGRKSSLEETSIASFEGRAVNRYVYEKVRNAYKEKHKSDKKTNVADDTKEPSEMAIKLGRSKKTTAEQIWEFSTNLSEIYKISVAKSFPKLDEVTKHEIVTGSRPVFMMLLDLYHSQIDSININQGILIRYGGDQGIVDRDESNDKISADLRDRDSETLYLRIRFKDQSSVQLFLNGLSPQDCDYLYSRASFEEATFQEMDKNSGKLLEERPVKYAYIRDLDILFDKLGSFPIERNLRYTDHSGVFTFIGNFKKLPKAGAKTK